MASCYCMGPRPGHTLCPCRERAEDDRRRQLRVGPYRPYRGPTVDPYYAPIPRAGWSCPNCGKAHSPAVLTCPEPPRAAAPSPSEQPTSQAGKLPATGGER